MEATEPLVPAEPRFEVIDPVPRGVGESPVWDAGGRRLFHVSILDGEVHVVSMATGDRTTHRFASTVGAIGLCDSGRLVVALKAQVVLFDLETGATEPLCTVEHPVEKMRLNDGKVGPDGAFWVGSMDDRADKEPVGRLYRVTPEGGCTVVADGLKVSNGLAWSPDGRIMYHSDSRGPWVDAWDFDPATGEAGNRRRFLTLDEETGRPDGGACDVLGNYWSAGPSAGRLNCFSPEGRLIGHVVMPNVRPTMPCFGGPDMRTVFVTSLTQGLDADLLAAHPQAGTLLSLRVGVEGAPVHRFRR